MNSSAEGITMMAVAHVKAVLSSINPATGEVLRRLEPHGPDEIERRLERSVRAAALWRETPMVDRAALLMRVADRLEQNKREYGRLMTVEMGKPLVAAVQEAEKCALACRYYAQHGPGFLEPEPIAGSDERVEFHPLGVVLAVMPWNFPFWQVMRFATAALIGGNVALLKHASNVPQCALALEELFRLAGAPEGVFQTLLVRNEAVAAIIGDARVAAVTLTGSEGAGRAVGRTAGEHLKKTVLELGGSDPFIVMPSADFDRAVETAVKARTINNGQSCIAAKRFIVASPLYDRFEKAFVERMRALRVGDPFDEATDIGPLATPQIVEDLDGQVKQSVAAGARLLLGGTRRPGPGNFYEPTVLVNIPRNSPAYRDELFGPVASLFRAESLEEAVAIANDTSFGLAASAWTNDRAEAKRFSRTLEAGSVFINGMVVSDPRFPFGGIKHSGYGRELGSFGLREFVNIKTVRGFFPRG
jgi:succinate-semialdehyde dehydrogenase/glutarate-semialdehyde dehydrogenase